MVTRSPAASGASVGRWCGIAEFPPAATIVSKLGPVAPWATIRSSSSRATSRSVRPGASTPSAIGPGQRRVGGRARQAQGVDLGVVLDRPQRLDEPGRAPQLGPGGRREGVQGVDGDLGAVETDRGRRRGRAQQRRAAGPVDEQREVGGLGGRPGSV